MTSKEWAASVQVETGATVALHVASSDSFADFEFLLRFLVKLTSKANTLKYCKYYIFWLLCSIWFSNHIKVFSVVKIPSNEQFRKEYKFLMVDLVKNFDFSISKVLIQMVLYWFWKWPLSWTRAEWPLTNHLKCIAAIQMIFIIMIKLATLKILTWEITFKVLSIK